jgi:hypothetical protein
MSPYSTSTALAAIFSFIEKWNNESPGYQYGNYQVQKESKELESFDFFLFYLDWAKDSNSL